MSMHGVTSVIVCGGGLAGITFVASLIHCCKSANIPAPQIIILEKCPSKESKLGSREYTISLRDTDALSFLGLEKKAEEFVSPSKRFYVAAYDWSGNHNKYISVPSNVPGSDSLRIKMGDLYNILFGLLTPDLVNVVWNAEVARIQEIGPKVNVSLKDGKKLTSDFVVVADGHRSSLRAQLFPEEKLRFAGAVGISGIAHTTNFPEEAERSHGMTLGNDSLLWISHEDKNHALWAVMYESKKTLIGPVINRDGVEESDASRKKRADLRDLVLSRYGPSYPVLQSLVPSSPLSSIRVINGFDKLPHASGKKYNRIVLIGDANHPVTPLSGIGASMALTDAKKLAQELTSAVHPNLESVIRSFESDMINRTAKVVKQGRFSIKLLLSPNPFWVYAKYIIFSIIGFMTRNYQSIKWGSLGAAVILGMLLIYYFLNKL